MTQFVQAPVIVPTSLDEAKVVLQQLCAEVVPVLETRLQTVDEYDVVKNTVRQITEKHGLVYNGSVVDVIDYISQLIEHLKATNEQLGAEKASVLNELQAGKSEQEEMTAQIQELCAAKKELEQQLNSCSEALAHKHRAE